MESGATEHRRNGRDEDSETIVDVKLFKVIGLHQLLQPARYGVFGRWYRTTLKTVLWLTFGVYVVQTVGLYFSVNDFQRLAYMSVLAFHGMTCTAKGYVVVANADRMWTTLAVARLDMTRFSGGDGASAALRHGRAAVSTFLRAYAAVSVSTLVIWVVMPVFIEQSVSVIGWVPGLSEAQQNSLPFWSAKYVIESVTLSSNVFNWMLFDSYFLTMCFALKLQIRILSNYSETIGLRSPTPFIAASASLHSPAIVGACMKKTYDSQSSHYEDLVNYIQESQNIKKIFDDFLNIIRQVVLVQIAIGLYSIVTLSFLTMCAYINDESVLSPLVLKFFMGLLSMVFQLYLYCFAFNYIETEKSQINTALHNSNWTEMDLKFKKTLLLAMSINSTNKRIIGISPKYTVNKELFAKVINKSYSIVPVLLNIATKK